MYDKGLLSHKVAESIKEMIKDRDFKAGDKLPNELVLTDELNVSRSTLREAIKILVTDNILEVKRGLGTFVSENTGVKNDPLGIGFLEEKNLLKHLFEVRLVVEPQIAELAASRCSDSEIDMIEKAYKEVKNAIVRGGNHSQADIEFHNAIAASTHNPIMQRLVPIITEGIQAGVVKTKEIYESNDELIRQHESIMKAIAKRDSAGAKKAMEKHIRFGLEKVSE